FIPALGLFSAIAQQAATSAAAPSPPAASQVMPVSDFVRDDTFEQIRISPTGKYLARTIHLVDKDSEKTVLVIQQRSDGKMTAHFNLMGKTQVLDFWWVNNERVLMSVGQQFGELERPEPTGELYGINADDSNPGLLIGSRVYNFSTGTHITGGKATTADAAFMVSNVPSDPKHVIVSVWPRHEGNDAYTKAASMDVDTGETRILASAPVRRAEFKADLEGAVRFAKGSGIDNRSKTYYRDDAKSDWVLLNDQSVSNVILTPLGFGADGRTAYLVRQDAKKGPDTVVAYDTVGHSMRDVLRDPVADPSRVPLLGPHHEVIGVRYLDARPRSVFFDEDSVLAKLFRSLERSFPDQSVRITDYTTDGKLALVFTYSDRSPGDYYLFDTEQKHAEHLISHRDWIEPERMGEQRPIVLKARDGTSLHGFVTLPAGSNGKNLPMVVNPHGGPIGIADTWGFRGETQLLASRGYAVLQVNYRGSSGFGRSFETSGYQQWGGTMQDDLTDATHWAIEQGIADPHRICIYGGSYGGYAALMGVAKEPALYRCAIGYIGVYDLPSMYHDGDISESPAALNMLKEHLGQSNLESISPDRLADRITVPVMLAAGKEDKRAPPRHTELMRDALLKAGKSVDAKIYDAEGHGFFIEANREDFYTRMLSFLDRNIGSGGVANAPAAGTH
ncbi:MAG TPA: S9 family peptidase, partial [Xanthomonadaceae bacterium]|nr:S9 family peptidase [Xanthomonadaceae bacterium]